MVKKVMLVCLVNVDHQVHLVAQVLKVQRDQQVLRVQEAKLVHRVYLGKRVNKDRNGVKVVLVPLVIKETSAQLELPVGGV